VYCPACKVPIIVVEHEKIELDYCTTCLGVWFDAGELALLLESLDLDVGEFNVSEGVWFDGGEVGQVITQRLDKSSAKPGAPDRVVNFLGEVFQARE